MLFDFFCKVSNQDRLVSSRVQDCTFGSWQCNVKNPDLHVAQFFGLVLNAIAKICFSKDGRHSCSLYSAADNNVGHLSCYLGSLMRRARSAVGRGPPCRAGPACARGGRGPGRRGTTAQRGGPGGSPECFERTATLRRSTVHGQYFVQVGSQQQRQKAH